MILSVRIMFQREGTATAGSASMSAPLCSAPIVACKVLLLIVAVDQNVAIPSTAEEEERPVNVHDNVSTEDLHLVCAWDILFTNMHIHVTPVSMMHR